MEKYILAGFPGAKTQFIERSTQRTTGKNPDHLVIHVGTY